MKRKTTFSPDPDRIYPYSLWREFPTESFFADGNKINDKFVQFIGLNPSTADETEDDPTIRRCVGFAKAWGYGAMCMNNLFAYRATSPTEMMKFNEPVAEKNDKTKNDILLGDIAKRASMVICAWGERGKFNHRDTEIISLLENSGAKLYQLGLNKDGTPKHPLRLRKNTQPQPFVVAKNNRE